MAELIMPFINYKKETYCKEKKEISFLAGINLPQQSALQD